MELRRSLLTSASPGRAGPVAMVPAPIELKRGMGSSTTDRKFRSSDRGGACSRSRSVAAAAALNDHRNLAALTDIVALSRARRIGKNKAADANRPCTSLLQRV